MFTPFQFFSSVLAIYATNDVIAETKTGLRISKDRILC